MEDKSENRLLKRREVEAMTGMARATIYKKMNAGIFPRPKVLSPKSVGWTLRDIQEWIDNLPAKQ